MLTPHKVTLTSNNAFTIKAFAKSLSEFADVTHFNTEIAFTLEAQLTHYGSNPEADQVILEAFLDDIGITALFEPGTYDEPKTPVKKIVKGLEPQLMSEAIDGITDDLLKRYNPLCDEDLRIVDLIKDAINAGMQLTKEANNQVCPGRR
jgi:hypothetical protein